MLFLFGLWLSVFPYRILCAILYHLTLITCIELAGVLASIISFLGYKQFNLESCIS